MIEYSYAFKILDALFHTEGSIGSSPDEEKTIVEEVADDNYNYLTRYANKHLAIEIGTKLNDVLNMLYDSEAKAEKAYNDAVVEIEQKYLEGKAELVGLNLSWYDIVSDDAQADTVERTLKYKGLKKNDETGNYEEATLSKTKTYTANKGWTLKKLGEQSNNYPTQSYLALFTDMPDQNGKNYKEPVLNVDVGTTYMRVNLHEDIIFGKECLNKATANAENGSAEIVNSYQIMYPEVFGVDWGEIKGFGVFETAEAMSGNPVLWGRISNEERVDATTEHVPLFRAGDFKVSLS